MKDGEPPGFGMLIDLSDKNNLGGGGSGGGGGSAQAGPPGFIGYPPAPNLPMMPMPPTNLPFNYPSSNPACGSNSLPSAPFNYNIPPNAVPSGVPEKKDLNINTNFLQVEKLN